MALNKAIEHGKEHRKPYTGSKAIDSTCRNHGSCPWCKENRLHKFRDKHPVEKGGTECLRQVMDIVSSSLSIRTKS